MFDPVQTLQQLIALPSVNPMGRTDVSGPEYFEHRVTDYLEQLFIEQAIPYRRQTVAPLRDNIVARLEGSPPLAAGGELVMLEAHQDTVPVTGMTIPPFSPTISQGRIQGRGSCDIKGGLTAMLAAFFRLAAEPPAKRPTVVMACTVNEECGFSGARDLVQLWQSGEEPLLPRVPDWCIVAEPTSLDVVVAHKGTARWDCTTTGRASHSSRPELGVNAIYRMAQIIRAVEQYQREVIPTLPVHPLCGGPSISIGMIRGGISVNTVPDRCQIGIDRRTLPGESAQEAREAVIRYIAERIDFEPIHEPAFYGTGLSDANNSLLATELASAAADVCGRGAKIGVPYGTNASVFGNSGVPTVVFGPGSIAQAHTEDEWLPLDELHTASEVLYEYLRRKCS